MSGPRLALTSAAMGAVATALSFLAPGPRELLAALAGGQRTVDAHGADALLVAATGLLAWAVWAWGALGLGLTALSAAPGLLGSLARLLLRGLLPAAARRTAALALGLGLATGVGVATAVTPAGAAVPIAASVPDWPSAEPAEPPAPAPVPHWPVPVPGDAHVVVRGDCLWTVAGNWLRVRDGAEPAAREIAAAVHAWWTANAEVIGPDPDLLLPGQVLVPPP
jgi:nucleoid-associated protein YgaU